MELEEDPTAEPDPLDDWRMPYLDYLLCDARPEDKTEARRLTRHAKSFILVEGELYKRSHTEILQLYIPSEQGRLLLSDIHCGVCGHHAVPRTFVGNTFRQGFYWPTTVADAEQIMRTHLRRVPVLRSANSPPSPGTPDDPHHVALCGLGA